ncbi:MAG: Uncharacterised protein [Synechococcus sp. CC9902]|nr:MAG: Uncharacterised protein [Synechococcus sp. CC9902]
MSSTTQLHRHPWHIHYTHHIGVLLPEHRHSTSLFGLIDRHLLHHKAVGRSNPAIDQRLDLQKLIRSHRLGAVKVEAQTVEVHQ